MPYLACVQSLSGAEMTMATYETRDEAVQAIDDVVTLFDNITVGVFKQPQVVGSMTYRLVSGQEWPNWRDKVQ